MNAALTFRIFGHTLGGFHLEVTFNDDGEHFTNDAVKRMSRWWTRRLTA